MTILTRGQEKPHNIVCVCEAYRVNLTKLEEIVAANIHRFLSHEKDEAQNV